MSREMLASRKSLLYSNGYIRREYLSVNMDALTCLEVTPGLDLPIPDEIIAEA
jgi:hypothetical protein